MVRTQHHWLSAESAAQTSQLAFLMHNKKSTYCQPSLLSGKPKTPLRFFFAFFMTTVEPYRPPTLDFRSDAHSNARRPHSSSNSIARDVPPAAPSPPRLYTTSPPRKPHTAINPSPTYNMAADEPSQWLFTEEEIRSSPTIMDGVDPVEERCRRAKGINFIIQAGIMLKLPQLTLATAAVFFQRFYMRRSMVTEKQGIHHYVGSLSSNPSSVPHQRPRISLAPSYI